MGTINEEYAAFREHRQLADDYAAFRAQKEREQGGVIRAPQPGDNDFRNPPYGSVIGGLGGSIIGGVVAGPGGAIGGGLGGSIVGEAVQQGVEKLIGSPGAPQSPMESATRLGREALIGTGSELGGQVLSRPFAGRRIAPGIPASVTPQAKEAMRYLEPRYTKQALLPAEATEHAGLDLLQNVAEHSIFGRGTIEGFKKRRYDEVFSKIADEIVTDLGPRLSPDQVGRMVVDSVQRNREVATLPATMIYRAIDQYVAPEFETRATGMKTSRSAAPITERRVVDVPTGKTGVMGEPITKSEVQEVKTGEKLTGLRTEKTEQERQVSGARINLSPLKSQFAGLLRVARGAGGLEDRAMGTTLLEFMERKPDAVSYPVAKAIRTEIRAYRDALKNSPETKNSPAIARANSIYDSLTKSIRAGLNEYDPVTAQMWDEANLIERGGQSQYNNKIIRKLVKSAIEEGGGKPEAIAGKVLAPNNITTINYVKNAVEPKDWDGILSVKMRQMLQSAQEQTGAAVPTGKIIGKRLESEMFGPNGIGEKSMIAAYGPQRVREYKQLVNALKISQEPQGVSTGSVAIQLLQTGYAYQAAGAVASAVGISQEEVDPAVIGAGGALLFGPSLMARMMTTKGGAQWLLDGMRIPAGTTKAAGWLGRGVSMLYPREAPVRQDTAEGRAAPIVPLTRPTALPNRLLQGSVMPQ